MSGICGIFEPSRQFSAGTIAGMLEALSFYGDSPKTGHAGSSCALGVAGRWDFQQCATFDGVAVAADADIVDRRGVGELLSVPSNVACSMNVAEIVARLYVARGENFLELLHGAFALALWDERKQRLLLALDRFGIKSLYRRQEGPRTIFGSRISAIRAAQEAPPEADPAALLQFLIFSSIPAPLSSDRGVEKLRPGTYVVAEARRVTEHQYWDLEFPEQSGRSVSQWSDELKAAMRLAVHRNLDGRAQENTGCYLSGGTDSSSVVAFTSEVFRPAQSFSIAFNESAFSEIEFARTAAATFRTRHFEQFLTPQDACNSIEKIVNYFDEPFANSSAVGSYHCAVLARQNGVDTLLAGDGGDELFGGNHRYARDKYFSIYGKFPAWLRRGLVEPLAGMLPANGSTLSLPRKYIRRASIPNPRRMLSYGFFLSSPAHELFEPAFLNQVGTENWLAIPEAHFGRARATSELNRILYMDVKMTLADNDLRKVSGTAEIAGVSVRYPLLDDRLAEFSGRIPARLKLKGFEKRYIFKQAMRGILPDKILYKKKHGFGVPLAQWLLQNPRMAELMRDTLNERTTQQRGYFRKDFIAKLRDLHKFQPNYYGEIVWYLLALELWHRTHLQRPRKTVNAI